MNRLPADKQKKIALVAGATVGVVVLLWFVMISPLRAQQVKLRALMADSKSQVEKGQRSAALALQASNDLATASQRLNQEEDRMASGDLYAWMIQTMNQFKAPYAVEIPSIGKEISCEVGMFPKFPYKTVMFIVRGAAYYHDFGKFLADFENHFPYMRVQNLDLSSNTGLKEEDVERLNFTMEVVTLVKPLTP